MEDIKSKLKQDLKDFEKDKIKVVAIDIDGTLINGQTQCTDRTEQAVKKLIDTGREVYIVTGRLSTTSMAFAKQVGIQKYMINSNGAIVWDMQAQKPIYEKSLQLEEVEYLISQIRKYKLMCMIYDPSEYYYENVNEYQLQYLARAPIPGVNQNFDELNLSFIQKLFIMGDHEEIVKFYGELVDKYGDSLTILLTTPVVHNMANPDSPAKCIEIMANGVNKGIALKEFVESQGYSMDEVVAFGDDVNDKEMLGMAGWGVAMHNAHPIVKESARTETLSNNDDGVAYFIENYLL